MDMAEREYVVLYTHQKTKKAKTWQDGFLKVSCSSQRAVLYDEKKTKLDSMFIKPEDIIPGEQLESDRYLILVEEVQTPIISQSQAFPVIEDQSNVSSYVGNYMKSTKPCDSNIAEPQTLSWQRSGLKRKRTGFVAPRMLKQSCTEPQISYKTEPKQETSTGQIQSAINSRVDIMNLYSRQNTSSETSRTFHGDGILFPQLSNFMSGLEKSSSSIGNKNNFQNTQSTSLQTTFEATISNTGKKSSCQESTCSIDLVKSSQITSNSPSCLTALTSVENLIEGPTRVTCVKAAIASSGLKRSASQILALLKLKKNRPSVNTLSMGTSAQNKKNNDNDLVVQTIFASEDCVDGINKTKCMDDDVRGIESSQTSHACSESILADKLHLENDHMQMKIYAPSDVAQKVVSSECSSNKNVQCSGSSSVASDSCKNSYNLCHIGDTVSDCRDEESDIEVDTSGVCFEISFSPTTQVSDVDAGSDDGSINRESVAPSVSLSSQTVKEETCETDRDVLKGHSNHDISHAMSDVKTTNCCLSTHKQNHVNGKQLCTKVSECKNHVRNSDLSETRHGYVAFDKGDPGENKLDVHLNNTRFQSKDDVHSNNVSYEMLFQHCDGKIDKSENNKHLDELEFSPDVNFSQTSLFETSRLDRDSNFVNFMHSIPNYQFDTDSNNVTEQKSTLVREEQKSTLVREEQKSILVREEQKSTLVREEQKSTLVRGEQKSTLVREEQKSTLVREEQKSTLVRGEQKSTLVRGEQKSTLVREEQKSTLVREEQKSTLVREEQTSTLVKEEQKSTLVREEQKEAEYGNGGLLTGMDHSFPGSQKSIISSSCSPVSAVNRINDLQADWPMLSHDYRNKNLTNSQDSTSSGTLSPAIGILSQQSIYANSSCMTDSQSWWNNGTNMGDCDNCTKTDDYHNGIKTDVVDNVESSSLKDGNINDCKQILLTTCTTTTQQNFLSQNWESLSDASLNPVTSVAYQSRLYPSPMKCIQPSRRTDRARHSTTEVSGPAVGSNNDPEAEQHKISTFASSLPHPSELMCDRSLGYSQACLKNVKEAACSKLDSYKLKGSRSGSTVTRITRADLLSDSTAAGNLTDVSSCITDNSTMSTEERNNVTFSLYSQLETVSSNPDECSLFIDANNGKPKIVDLTDPLSQDVFGLTCDSPSQFVPDIIESYSPRVPDSKAGNRQNTKDGSFSSPVQSSQDSYAANEFDIPTFSEFIKSQKLQNPNIKRFSAISKENIITSSNIQDNLCDKQKNKTPLKSKPFDDAYTHTSYSNCHFSPGKHYSKPDESSVNGSLYSENSKCQIVNMNCNLSDSSHGCYSELKHEEEEAESSKLPFQRCWNEEEPPRDDAIAFNDHNELIKCKDIESHQHRKIFVSENELDSQNLFSDCSSQDNMSDLQMNISFPAKSEHSAKLHSVNIATCFQKNNLPDPIHRLHIDQCRPHNSSSSTPAGQTESKWRKFVTTEDSDGDSGSPLKEFKNSSFGKSLCHNRTLTRESGLSNIDEELTGSSNIGKEIQLSASRKEIEKRMFESEWSDNDDLDCSLFHSSDRFHSPNGKSPITQHSSVKLMKDMSVKSSFTQNLREPGETLEYRDCGYFNTGISDSSQQLNVHSPSYAANKIACSNLDEHLFSSVHGSLASTRPSLNTGKSIIDLFEKQSADLPDSQNSESSAFQMKILQPEISSDEVTVNLTMIETSSLSQSDIFFRDQNFKEGRKTMSTKFQIPLMRSRLTSNIMTGSERNICGELQFPSRTEVEQNVTPTRDVVIPATFSSVALYKQVFTAALKEHLNIILFELSKNYHHTMGTVDTSGYAALKSETVGNNGNMKKTSKSENPPCQCGAPAKFVQVKKEGANKGRYFYACSKDRRNQCKFFQWADQVAVKTGIHCRYTTTPCKPKLSDNASIMTFLRGQKITFFCQCQFVKKLDAFSNFKKNCPAWSRHQYSEDNAKKKMFLRLTQKESSSLYNKDDLWIISRHLDFDPLHTFLARSTYFGPNSNNEVEIEPLTGFSQSNWTNNACCHAILAGNAASELTCILTIQEHLQPAFIPILTKLLNRELPETHLKSSRHFHAPVQQCQGQTYVHVKEQFVDSLVKKYISTHRLNTDQATALGKVAAMFYKDETDAEPCVLIHGVFGAGKSFLLSVIVMFLVKLFEENDVYSPGVPYPWKLLISSTTNVAVDRILCGLLDLGFEDFVRVGSVKKIAKPVLPKSVHATGSASQELKQLQDMLRSGELTASEKYFVRQSIEKHKAGENRKKLGSVRVVGVTCAACVFSCLDSFTFPVVLLDECSQMTEPASLHPIAKFGCQKLILVGDPKQLDPTIQGSEPSHEEGLEQTLFDRLILMGYVPTLLKTQYRCHPTISAMANTLFYDGQLIDGVSNSDRHHLVDFPTLCFYNVGRGQESSDFGISYYNEAESMFVVTMIEAMVLSGVEPVCIGVITLYKSQMFQIVNRLHGSKNANHNEMKAIQVSTVDAFQGGEKEIIILSCVRTNSVGFIDNDKRTNVALTRAKRHLLIIGNARNLSRSQLWGRVIQHCKVHPDGIQDAEEVTEKLKLIIKEKMETATEPKSQAKSSQSKGKKRWLRPQKSFLQNADKDFEDSPPLSLSGKSSGSVEVSLDQDSLEPLQCISSSAAHTDTDFLAEKSLDHVLCSTDDQQELDKMEQIYSNPDYDMNNEYNDICGTEQDDLCDNSLYSRLVVKPNKRKRTGKIVADLLNETLENSEDDDLPTFL